MIAIGIIISVICLVIICVQYLSDSKDVSNEHLNIKLDIIIALLKDIKSKL